MLLVQLQLLVPLSSIQQISQLAGSARADCCLQAALRLCYCDVRKIRVLEQELVKFCLNTQMMLIAFIITLEEFM